VALGVLLALFPIALLCRPPRPTVAILIVRH
jgi:hypothetical protein